ncbi:MAG: hypothetical protein ACREVL_18020 [Solimonas sp.]
MRMKIAVAALIAALLAGCDQKQGEPQDPLTKLAAATSDAIVAGSDVVAKKIVSTLEVHKEVQPGRSKEQCLVLTGNFYNEQYVECRNGWVEEAQYDAYGRRHVLRRYPLPQVNVISSRNFVRDAATPAK